MGIGLPDGLVWLLLILGAIGAIVVLVQILFEDDV